MRAIWMAFGHLGLIACLMLVATGDGGYASIPSLLYWVIAAAVVGARWLDVTRYEGRTGSGEAATVAHAKRFAVVLSVAAVVAWFAAHALA